MKELLRRDYGALGAYHAVLAVNDALEDSRAASVFDH
jgi:hypothetical protein